MGSQPTMIPATPRTVSPTAGWQVAETFWICWRVAESGHVAFGNWVAEATPAAERSAATARKRVSSLCMWDPLVAGERSEIEARSGGQDGLQRGDPTCT